MALNEETRRRIIQAAIAAHLEGRPLFRPRPAALVLPSKHERLLEAFRLLDELGRAPRDRAGQLPDNE
jgi:hypothetical protein